MDLQEAFDRVYNGILDQGEPSVIVERHYKTAHVACVYRGPHDLKCAAGMLIADEHYSDSLENLCVQDDAVVLALERSGVSTPIVCHVYLWQGHHDVAARNALNPATGEIDKATFLRAFSAGMKAFARAQGLTIPVRSGG